MLKRLRVLLTAVGVSAVMVGSYVMIGHQYGISFPELWQVEIAPGSASFDALLMLVMMATALGAVHGVLHIVLQIRPMYDLHICLAFCMGVGLLVAMPGYGPFLVPVVPPLAYLLSVFLISADGHAAENADQPAAA